MEQFFLQPFLVLGSHFNKKFSDWKKCHQFIGTKAAVPFYRLSLILGCFLPLVIESDRL